MLTILMDWRTGMSPRVASTKRYGSLRTVFEARPMIAMVTLEDSSAWNGSCWNRAPWPLFFS